MAGTDYTDSPVLEMSHSPPPQVPDMLLAGAESAAHTLAQHAASVARHNFEWRFVTLVLFVESVSLGVGSFIRAYRNTLVVARELPALPSQPKQFVLYGRSSEDIMRLLEIVTEAKCDNTAQYLIVCGGTQCDEVAAMEQFWRLRIVNVMFLKMSNSMGATQFFTYFPFRTGECENRLPIEINFENSCLNDTCFKNLYPEKFRNLHTCSIVASSFDQPPFMLLSNESRLLGAEGELLSLLTGMMNASLRVVTPTSGDGWGYLDGGDWKGSLGDVYHGRAHFSMASTAITLARYNNFHASFPYNSVDVVWVTAPSHLKPGWEKLMYPYTFSVRVALGATFLFITVLSSFTKSKKWNEWRRQIEMGQLRTNLLFLSCVIFLGMPVNRLPTKIAVSAILLMWIWFTFIVRTGYQASLVSALKMSVYEKEYDSFEDAAVDMQFGGVPSLREYFQNESFILGGWNDMDAAEIFPMMNKLAKGESKFMFAINKAIVLEFLRSHWGKYNLQIIPQRIVNIPVAIFYKKYSPLNAPMSRLLTVLMEAGLWQKLQSQYMLSERTLRAWAATASQGPPQPLSLENFAGCWTIIIVGWILSLIFFIIEVIFGRVEYKSTIFLALNP